MNLSRRRHGMPLWRFSSGSDGVSRHVIFLQELPANTPHGLEAKICPHSIEVFQQKEIVLPFPPHNLLATHPLQSRLGQPQRCVV